MQSWALSGADMKWKSGKQKSGAIFFFFFGFTDFFFFFWTLNYKMIEFAVAFDTALKKTVIPR